MQPRPAGPRTEPRPPRRAPGLRLAPAGLLSAAILAAFLPGSGAAQIPGAAPSAAGRIAGSVTDSAGAPLSTVTVTLRSAADSSVVTGVLTLDDGRFRLENLRPGSYLLHVARIGFRPRSSEAISITSDRPVVDLGTIRLDAAAIELEGVEAVVDRPAVVVEADRTIYDTRSMPAAAAGTATDVLRAVPELEVDVNDNVRLQGNQQVAIHLNGRPTPLQGDQLAQFLRQLPGDRVARVEVLPNPSARHDPEGMGGIVNIVLKDDVELGLSGSVNVNASNRNRQFVGGRFNVQRGRLTLFTGIGAGLFRNEGSSWDLRENRVTDPVTLIRQDGSTDGRGTSWNGDWTAEFRVREGGTVWSNAWFYGNEMKDRGSTAYRITDSDSVVLERFDRRQRDDGHWSHLNVGLGFKQVVQAQREEFTAELRMVGGENSRDGVHDRLFHVLAQAPVDRPLEVTLNEVDQSNGNLTAQVDYFRPVLGSRLDLGYRFNRRDQDNLNLLQRFEAEGDPLPLEELRGGYDYEERFHALYGTWALTKGAFGAQVGARAELSATDFYSPITGDDFSRSYNTLYPSLNLSWTRRPGQSVRVLYSKRINRPTPFQLDPFVPPTDPLNRAFGNPDLRPSYTDSYSMDATWSGSVGTVRVAPFYRESTDVWERIRTVDTLGVATSRWENAASSTSLGSNFTLSLRSGGRLSGSTNLSLYRDSRDGTNIASGLRRTNTLWSVGGNVGLRLSETLTTQLFGNHFPTQSILQGRASGYTYMSVAFRQQVMESRGTLSLSVNDPFNMTRFSSSSSDATYRQEGSSSFSNRVAMLGFSYTFGRAPQRQSRPVGSPEEGGGETIRVP